MNIDRDKLIEMAKEAGFTINGESIEVNCDYQSEWTITDELKDFASLVSAHAITSMQTEQEPIAEVKLDADGMKYIHWNGHHWTQMLSAGAKIYTHPAPVTSMQGDSEPVSEWLETEITAIDTWYRGSPSYMHDAYWFKDQVLDLIRKSKSIIDNPTANDRIKGVSDETLESIIENSNGRWHEDIFHVEGPDLMNMLRRASQLSTNTDGWVRVTDLEQILHDPENQPSQYGTIPYVGGWVSVPKVATSEILNAIHQAWKTAPMNTDSYVLWEKMYNAIINAISQDKGESV